MDINQTGGTPDGTLLLQLENLRAASTYGRLGTRIAPAPRTIRRLFSPRLKRTSTV